MKHRKLATNANLQRVMRVLREAKGPISTMELIREARICAVNSVIAELRENGAEITCKQVVEDGKRRWEYTLMKSPGLSPDLKD